MFFRVPIFQTLSEARSQLYQRRFLRPRPHFSAFFKLYIFSFAPFQISLIFQDRCTIFWQNSMQFLLIFLEDSRFCNFSSNFSGFFPELEFRRISMISERVMSRFSYFRELWEILPKFCKILMQNCWKSVRKKVLEMDCEHISDERCEALARVAVAHPVLLRVAGV